MDQQSQLAAPSAGVQKRSRQACSPCRSRKIKCSGERPVCTNCRQTCRNCVYEPYSSRATKDAQGKGDKPGTSARVSLSSLEANTQLLSRISKIESMLAQINAGASDSREPKYSSPGSASASPETSQQDQSRERRLSSIVNPDPDQERNTSFDTLPPLRVLSHLVDTYFARVHGQPYTYFHEGDFRRRFQNGMLPNCLLFAVSALAIRFSSHSYFLNRVHEASAAYSKQAWVAVVSDHLIYVNKFTLPVVQTVAISAIVDYTSGKVGAGWLKVGMAARLSQGLNLMTEPPSNIPTPEQEERRRTFWSIYILDKLISCSRSHPPAILDADCSVHLPREEDGVQAVEQDNASTESTATYALQCLLGWDTDMSLRPRGSVLIILMASVLGRCTRFAHGASGSDIIPPWDPKSDFMAINSSLMLLESYLDMDTDSVFDVVREGRHSDPTREAQQLGHLIYARALFYLCHCLLNHPFLLRVRLKPFANKAPRSFCARALQVVEENAKGLTELLTMASAGGALIESSFYIYCVAISGGIHAMACHEPRKGSTTGQYDAQHYFQQSTDVLRSLVHLWPMAGNIKTRLHRFYDLFPTPLGLFDSSSMSKPLNPAHEELLWSVTDYTTLAGELPMPDVFPSISALPSPSAWEMDPIMNIEELNPDFNNAHLFQDPILDFGESPNM